MSAEVVVTVSDDQGVVLERVKIGSTVMTDREVAGRVIYLLELDNFHVEEVD